MPIYAYRCEECGFAKDVLQKMSDEPLSVCLSCGKSSFQKQVTAAGFQLKGSGWYVTDFRGGSGNNGAAAAPADESTPSTPATDTSTASAGSSASVAPTAPVAAAATSSASSDGNKAA